MIELPDGFTEGIATEATGLLGEFSGPVTLILGVLLTAVVIELIVHAIRKG